MCTSARKKTNKKHKTKKHALQTVNVLLTNICTRACPTYMLVCLYYTLMALDACPTSIIFEIVAATGLSVRVGDQERVQGERAQGRPAGLQGHGCVRTQGVGLPFFNLALAATAVSIQSFLEMHSSIFDEVEVVLGKCEGKNFRENLCGKY